MAGRAGRRGLDETGTVVILAKGDTLPDRVELTAMILGYIYFPGYKTGYFYLVRCIILFVSVYNIFFSGVY